MEDGIRFKREKAIIFRKFFGTVNVAILRLTVGIAFAPLSLPMPDIKLCTAAAAQSRIRKWKASGRPNATGANMADLTSIKILAARIKPKSVELD